MTFYMTIQMKIKETQSQINQCFQNCLSTIQICPKVGAKHCNLFCLLLGFDKGTKQRRENMGANDRTQLRKLVVEIFVFLKSRRTEDFHYKNMKIVDVAFCCYQIWPIWTLCTSFDTMLVSSFIRENSRHRKLIKRTRTIYLR